MTLISAVQDFGRAMGGALFQASATCPPGAVVVGGGSVVEFTPPNENDTKRIHALYSGPTMAGTWTVASTAVSTASPGSNMRFVVSALCVPGEP